jgi:sugar lactone lactonase YvrE
MMNGPQGLVLDSLGNLYVSDTQNHRISKFNASGLFQGWVGKIATSPAGGGSGCNGAAVGAVTPDWCTGGTSASGSGDGMLNTPFNIALDSSGNLYIADSNNSRIIRFSIRGK